MAAYLEIAEPDALDQLLFDAGISMDPSARDKAQTRVVEVLRGLEKLPVNEAEGGVRVIVQGHHIAIKPVLWEIVAGSLALVPKALDPSGISQTVGLVAFGTALIKLKDKITGLSDFQIVLCHAVVKVAREKAASGKIFMEPGASPEEVRRELRTQLGQDFENVAELLKNLSPKVLTEKFYEASGPFYQLIP